MDRKDLRIDTYRPGNAVTITHLPTGIVSTSADKNTYEANKAECMAALAKHLGSSARLERLPENLRTVAAEFLGLHNAWGTEFQVHLAFGPPAPANWPTTPATPARHSGFNLSWASGTASAFFDWELTSNGPVWSSSLKEYARGPVPRYEVQISGSAIGPGALRQTALRRSADFAEFVQRFARTVSDG